MEQENIPTFSTKAKPETGDLTEADYSIPDQHLSITLQDLAHMKNMVVVQVEVLKAKICV
jgi:hypothetical protein